MRALAGTLAAVLMAGLAPAPVAAAETYTITAEVWGVFQKYLGKIKNGRYPGAYAITKDGTGAYYVWCEHTQCMAGTAYSTDAVNACEREYDTECVTFAVRDDIRVTYTVAGSESSNSVAPELSAPPPPAAKIVVSAAVKAEIEAYLASAQRAGRASALAIAQDGSDVAAASCPTSGGWSGGRACEPIKGSPQELASREAVMQCGGAADCVLLYEGTQQTGRVEIVAQ